MIIEAEMQADTDARYDEYLDSLVESGQLYLYAIEVYLDMIHSDDFKKSGLSFQDYLVKRKEMILKRNNDRSRKGENNDSLPF